MARLDHKEPGFIVAHLSLDEACDLANKLVWQIAQRGGAAPAVAIFEQGSPHLRIAFSVDPK